MEIFKIKLTASVIWVGLLCLLGGNPNDSFAQSKANQDSVIGQAYSKPTDSLSTIKEMEKLQSDIAVYRQTNNKHALVIVLNRYVRLCSDLNMKEKCLPLYHELKDLGSELKDERLASRSYSNLGYIMINLGKYDSAMFYCFKSLQLAEKTHNDTIICTANTCLGSIYNHKKNYSKSLELHSVALKYAEEIKGDTHLYLTCLVNKALAYSWLNKPEPAIELDLIALPLAEKSHEYNLAGTIQMNLASNYAALHAYSKANQYLENLVQVLPTYHLNPVDNCEKMVVVGLIYWDMRMVNKARYFLNQQLAVSDNLKHYYLQQRICDSLGVIAEYQKQLPDALRYFKLSQRYKDSMNAGENKRLVSELEVNYQTAQKEKALSEKQLQLVQKDAQILQNRHYTYFILGGMVLLVLVLLLLYYSYQNRQREHRRALQYLEQQKEYQLLQALMQGEEKERSRIARDLHDSMSGMVAAAKMHVHSLPLKVPAVKQTEGFRQAVEILDEVSAGIRKTSHHLMPEILLKLGLDEALRRYSIQLSNSDVLHIQYDSFGEIKRYKDSFELSVYRIVQELLNNVIRHSQATEVMVQMSVQEQIMSIAVEDNGKGIYEGEENESGTGLRYLEARVKAMNGAMQLNSQPGCGVQVYLEFDVTNMNC